MRTQESRIKVAEYERRCAEEDLARLREERAHVPSTPARTGPATDSSPSVIFERMDVVDASALSTPAAGAHDGFLNRIECADLVNVQPVPADPSAPLPDIDAGERRCLNLVTHQYLMRRGYRAAALALRQEATAGQCLDDWSPLGGEPARGEALRLVLRRAKAAETLDPTAFRDLRDERDESLLLIEECESNLKGVETTLSEKMSEIERLNEALAVERKTREEAGLECERWRSRAEEAAATVRHVERAAERMRSENSADPNAELSDNVGHDTSSSLTHSTKGSAALDAAHEEEATIHALLQSLPRISPHTLIQHRTELLPLYSRCATRARLPIERAAALAQMFACVKRPSGTQRHAIAETCGSIGVAMGESRTGAELMPSIAKNCAGHKHEERRLLGVECLASIARSECTRAIGGTVLTELVRIAAADGSATVRVAVVGAVVSALDTDAKRKEKVEADDDAGPAGSVADDLLMSLAMDSSDEVSNAAVELLGVSLARWRESNARGSVLTGTVPKFAAALAAALVEIARGGEDARWRVGTLSRTLEVFADAAEAAESDASAFEWIAECAGRTDRSEEGCVAAVARAVRAHCAIAGPSLVTHTILPKLIERASSAAGTSSDRTSNESAGLAIALAAVAPCGGEGAYEEAVRKLCADFKLGVDDDSADVDNDDSYESTSEAVSYAFEFAALFDGRHLASRTVGVLGTLAVDGDAAVRRRAAALIGASSAGLDPPHVLTRAIPVLSALIEDSDGSVRCEAARALCVACESHPNDEAVVDAAHRTLETFVDSRDLDAIVATSEGMGRAGLRTPRTEHCARSAATLARVASREATAAAAAGPEGLDGRVGDVGAALFAAIRAVLSSDENDDSSSGRQPSRLFETLAPALRRMLEVAPMLDASDRATAEAMLRDEDWRGTIEPLGQGATLTPGTPGGQSPIGATRTPGYPPSGTKKRSMFSYAYGGVRKHALGLPSRDPEKRRAEEEQRRRIEPSFEDSRAGDGVEDVAHGSPAVPTVSIDELLG